MFICGTVKALYCICIIASVEYGVIPLDYRASECSELLSHWRSSVEYKNSIMHSININTSL